MTCENICL